MPILSNFPGGSGSGGGGLTLAAVSGITTLTAHEKVYVKWTDPEDLVVAGSTLAAWGGTLLVRKAGSAPVSRRDGTIVLDSKTKNAYQNSYFCDSGLTNGVQYFYKFFPYTTSNAYTDSEDDAFTAIPQAVAPGNVTGKAATASGNGKLTVKWTDPAATIVSDGVTRSTWASTKVVYKTGSYPTSPDDGTLAINSTTRNAYATNGFQITGLTNGTTYYIAFFPVSTEGAVNTNAANRITGVPNRIAIANVPAQSGSLTYNGNSQTPSWSNYNSAQLTIGGTTSGTNAGTYNATFTPKSDYCWSNGSTSAETVAWSIGKAAGSLSLNKTSVELNASALTATVAVTRAGNGAISATSSNTGIATVSVSGTNVIISNVNQKTGSATITVKVAEGTNHLAPADKTVAVTAKFMPDKKALNDTSWADIRTVSAADQGANYWAVGDRKAVNINGTVGTLAVNATYYVNILGFNHNETHEGKGIHFGGFYSAVTGGTDLCLVDSKYNSYDTGGTKYFNMNHWGNYNYGGWAGCDLRYDVLGSTNKAPSGYGSAKTTSTVGYDAPSTTPTSPVANTLMAALPADLRAVMQPMTKYTDAVGNSSNVAANVKKCIDYLPLLAEFEIFGARTYANQYEQNYQAQYQFYKNGNSKVKYRHSSTGSTAAWWERSPCYYYTNSFCIVTTAGSATDSNARFSIGLAPAFKV